MTKFILLELFISLVGGFLLPGSSFAADIQVVSSGGFAAAYKELAPEFELPHIGKLKDKIPELSWQKIEKLQHHHCLMSGDILNQH